MGEIQEMGIPITRYLDGNIVISFMVSAIMFIFLFLLLYHCQKNCYLIRSKLYRVYIADIIGFGIYLLFQMIYWIALMILPEYPYIWDIVTACVLCLSSAILTVWYFCLIEERKKVHIAHKIVTYVWLLTAFAVYIAYEICAKVQGTWNIQWFGISTYVIYVITFNLYIPYNIGVIWHYRKYMEKSENNWLLITVSAVHLLRIINTGGVFLFIIARVLILIAIYLRLWEKRSIEMEIKQRELVEKNLTLTNNRINMILAQIDPHFLHQSLTSISKYCTADPDKAQEMILYLSDYIYSNLEAAKKKTCVPFEEELKRTMLYAKVERDRFHNKFSMDYDIHVTDFEIPPLSLQPIVANAIRRGIIQKIENEHITIISEETDDSYLVSVLDNGIILDVGADMAEERQHHELSALRTHLDTLCGASLKVDSQFGKGTKVTMTIPKHQTADISSISQNVDFTASVNA